MKPFCLSKVSQLYLNIIFREQQSDIRWMEANPTQFVHKYTLSRLPFQIIPHSRPSRLKMDGLRVIFWSTIFISMGLNQTKVNCFRLPTRTIKLKESPV